MVSYLCLITGGVVDTTPISDNLLGDFPKISTTIIYAKYLGLLVAESHLRKELFEVTLVIV